MTLFFPLFELETRAINHHCKYSGRERYLVLSAPKIRSRGKAARGLAVTRTYLYQAIECYLILIPFARRGLPVFRRHVVVGTTTLVATCKGHPTYLESQRGRKGEGRITVSLAFILYVN